MTQDLALQVVRKPKAKKSHLTVPASKKSDIRTLYGVEIKAGDYDAADGPADCQPCLRKKGNRAFISSAYFARDAGSRLLELSLQQAKAARPAGKARRTKKSRPAPRARGATTSPDKDLDQPSTTEAAALRVNHLKLVGSGVYQSPAGVLVKLQRRGAAWRVAEVVFDGPGEVLARSSGRTNIRLGDVAVEQADGSTGVLVTLKSR